MLNPPAPVMLFDELARLAHAVGTESFASALMQVARSQLAADQVVAFQFATDGQACLILAENAMIGQSVARSLADDYIARHLGLDPSLLAQSRSNQSDRSLIFHSVTYDEIIDEDYREALFERPGLRGKIAILAREPQGLIYINFYRAISRPPFAEDELALLETIAPLLVALIVRHNQIYSLPRPVNDTVQRLMGLICEARHARLSAQERLVCGLILAGVTNEGIALELGVSPHSVTSYRRRAFHKLDIATQKELFSLALQLQHG